jgi:hypothetical protein
MKSRCFAQLCTLALLCLTLTSCVDSESAMSEPEKAKLDEGLLGVWRAKREDDSTEYYHVAAAGGNFPQSVFRIIAVLHTNKGTLAPPIEVYAFPTTLGKNHYLNVALVTSENAKRMDREGWSRDLVKGYFILKYELNGDAITVAAMDKQAKKDAIESGEIMGRTGESPLFTDVSPKIVQLLMNVEQNDKLYGKTARTLERVK